jgi:hypothetical protein
MFCFGTSGGVKTYLAAFEIRLVVVALIEEEVLRARFRRRRVARRRASDDLHHRASHEDVDDEDRRLGELRDLHRASDAVRLHHRRTRDGVIFRLVLPLADEDADPLLDRLAVLRVTSVRPASSPRFHHAVDVGWSIISTFG